MIINDLTALKNSSDLKNIYVLEENSIRSAEIIKIIKKNHLYYSTCIFIFFYLNELDESIINNIANNNMHIKKHIIIIITNVITKNELVDKLFFFFKENFLIIRFKKINEKYMFFWIKLFFYCKLIYCQDSIITYLMHFFYNNIEEIILAINKYLILFKKYIKFSLLNFLLTINVLKSSLIDKDLFFSNKYNKSLFNNKKILSNKIEYTSDFNFLNFKLKNNLTKIIFIYHLLLLDLNKKANNTCVLDMLNLNFLIENIFIQKENFYDFDKLNIKYFTKK